MLHNARQNGNLTVHIYHLRNAVCHYTAWSRDLRRMIDKNSVIISTLKSLVCVYGTTDVRKVESITRERIRSEDALRCPRQQKRRDRTFLMGKDLLWAVIFIPMTLPKKVLKLYTVPGCSKKMFYKPPWAWARVRMSQPILRGGALRMRSYIFHPPMGPADGGGGCGEIGSNLRCAAGHTLDGQPD